MTIAIRAPSADTSLQAWAEEMSAAAQIARAVAGTPFVPSSLHVRENGAIDMGATTANIAAALLAGHELGLEPMAALRSIDIIEGTPALRAVAMRALVIARGASIWVEEASPQRVVVQGTAAGSSKIQQSVWDMARAERLGLSRKQNWVRQPQSMLTARATAELSRLIAPEALLGLPYSAEELGDGPASIDAPDGDEPAPAKRTARRRNTPTAPVAPRTPPAAPPATEHPPAGNAAATPPAGARPLEHAQLPDPPPDMITKAQLRAMHAAFRELDISDRAERLRITCEIIGRQVDTANDLYEREASTVIDELRQRKLRTDKARDQAEDADLDSDLDDPWHSAAPELDWGEDNPEPGGD